MTDLIYIDSHINDEGQLVDSFRYGVWVLHRVLPADGDYNRAGWSISDPDGKVFFCGCPSWQDALDSASVGTHRGVGDEMKKAVHERFKNGEKLTNRDIRILCDMEVE